MKRYSAFKRLIRMGSVLLTFLIVVSLTWAAEQK